MHYLQEEYSSLQVGGQYGPQTKAVFCSLQRNTSNLNAEAIENLKTAVSISQVNSHTPSGNQQSNFRGSFRGFGPRGLRASFRG